MTKNTYKKTALVIIIMGTIAVFRIFLLDRYLSLDYIKESQQGFAVLYSEHRIAVIAAYMLIYIFVTGLSLPGATVMTLAGGALFGLWVGAIVISFASTLGATLACLISRFLLRDWVQSKFGDKLSEINQGIEKEGLFYLFTLRLIPAFPFFVINLLMGLTKMPIFTFYWISQIGMFPATLVYVNAGKELAKIDSLSGILSPPLIISFVILGLFPIAAKKAVAFYKSGRGGL
ncbi:MAG TPA: TVP38/TMEM64 family protein [Nitrospiraceae bacterium]|nr:MAG: dihydrolipoamide dehydrogenase [Nitrospirae bacterium GWA2_46_11]OGW23363.1 MAG: dihydrolipoamide dehydrogenase [Nitrospirae bacterium GWB2_47_37]HAK87787.1 TVP38/TMEM64 family protein [Nitrospiraceae bacterium]HCZ11840.1 TVP38/TMEM64 family protein [Nitrospiraceae bacterium]